MKNLLHPFGSLKGRSDKKKLYSLQGEATQDIPAKAEWVAEWGGGSQCATGMPV